MNRRRLHPGDAGGFGRLASESPPEILLNQRHLALQILAKLNGKKGSEHRSLSVCSPFVPFACLLLLDAHPPTSRA
jgi:hypothetical protein